MGNAYENSENRLGNNAIQHQSLEGKSSLHPGAPALHESLCNPSRMHFLGWILDITHRHLLNPEGVIVSITGSEFRILRIFLEHPNKILHRDLLMNLLYGRDATPYDRSTDLQISRLRKKIEPDTRSASIIKTVRNEGYVLAARVTIE